MVGLSVTVPVECNSFSEDATVTIKDNRTEIQCCMHLG